MMKKSKKSSKRVTLRQKHKVLRKVKEHHRKKRKEANKEGKAGQRKKVEKDPGIPNEWPFKEQELKALEARRAQALQELESKTEARKETVCHAIAMPPPPPTFHDSICCYRWWYACC
jgi:nuclear GTP-binding protein